MEPIKLRCWNPYDDKVYKVEVIASQWQCLGNDVCEGRLEKEGFFPAYIKYMDDRLSSERQSNLALQRSVDILYKMVRPEEDAPFDFVTDTYDKLLAIKEAM